MTQNFVSAPFLAQLDRRALEISMILFELAFEARQQRKGIAGGSGKAGQNIIVVEPANFLALAFMRFRPGLPGHHRQSRHVHLSVPAARSCCEFWIVSFGILSMGHYRNSLEGKSSGPLERHPWFSLMSYD